MRFNVRTLRSAPAGHHLAERRFRRQFYQFHPDAVRVREIGVVHLRCLVECNVTHRSAPLLEHRGNRRQVLESRGGYRAGGLAGAGLSPEEQAEFEPATSERRRSSMAMGIPDHEAARSAYVCAFLVTSPALTHCDGGRIILRVAAQDIANRLIGNRIPEIGQGAHNPVIAPVSVLARHANDQLLDLSFDPRPARALTGLRAIEFAGPGWPRWARE
jgi:hypothetical protein